MTDHVSRVGGRFAGEVSGVEFLEGGVEVVGVEHDARRDPVVGVDLDDVEQFFSGFASEDRTRLSARRSPRVAMSEVMSHRPRAPRGLHIRDSGVPTRVGPRHSRRVGDRLESVVAASISAMAAQSRAAK